MKRTLALLVAILPAAGCVTSPDYIELWRDGSTDTSMVGQWQGDAGRQQEHVVNIGISSNTYQVHVTPIHGPIGEIPAQQYSYSFTARDVAIGTNTFMLCRGFTRAMLESMMQTNFPAASPEECYATLLRYDRHANSFTFHNLNCPLVQKSIDQGLIQGEKSPPRNAQGRRPVTTPRVARFDARTLKELEETFTKDEAWHHPITFTRENREHPAAHVFPKAASGL